MKHLILIAALLFAGCGKKSSSGPSCADAIDKAVAAMPGGPGGDEMKGKLRGIFTKHCTEDKWNADVIKCYANDAHDMQSMKACREKLTPEQQQAVMSDVRATMMGAMGGGGPMHGGPAMGGSAGSATGGADVPAGQGPAGGGPAPSGSDTAAPAGSAAP
jgi:hypothetical protein